MAQQTVVVDIALLGKMAGYIEMLVKDPYSTIFAALSDIYRTFGLHEEAVAVAERGTEMVPTYAPGFISLGRALAEKGNPAGATIAYRQALALDPVDLAALTGLASSCLGCGQSEEALAILAQAQAIDPDDEVVKQLSSIIQKLAATPSPVTMSIPAIQPAFVPAPSQPHQEITTAHVEEQSESAVANPILPPIATATLADIYIKQGFPERAVKVFSDLLLEDPDNTEIRQRHDELVKQIDGPVLTQSLETAPAPPVVVEATPTKTSSFSKLTGKEALIAMYGRWLDAVNRRRADVH